MCTLLTAETNPFAIAAALCPSPTGFP
jgi:hypothetical protein